MACGGATVSLQGRAAHPCHVLWGTRPSNPGAAELRQPLCLLLLRNCMSPHEQAVTAAVRIFTAILSAQVGAVGSGRLWPQDPPPRLGDAYD